MAMENDDLKALERRVYLASSDDGLWDVVLAAFVAMFALAPLLSTSLGDFWSVAVFVPFWGAVYLAVSLVRRLLLTPRLGSVRLGRARMARLRRFALVMVAVNLAALVAGFVAAFQAPTSGWWPTVELALMPLVFLSLAAYLLEIRRFFVYGLILSVAAVAGELLWQEGLVSHHGFPVMFGAAAAIIALGGLLRLGTLLYRSAPQRDAASRDIRPD